MSEVRLEMGEHPLSTETRRRFPWARSQPAYTRAELNRAVAEAAAMRQEWRQARDELSGLVPRLEASERAARASAPGSQGTAGEVAGFLARSRSLLAAGTDPEHVAGYPGAGRRTLAEVFRLLAQGVRPSNVRALNAVGRMRAGTETLRASLRSMRGLCERIAQAGPRWPHGAAWAETSAAPVSASPSAGSASTASPSASAAVPPSQAVGRVLADRPGPRAGDTRGAAPATPSPRRPVPPATGEHRGTRSL